MIEQKPIEFQAIDKGAGFHDNCPRPPSFYKEKDIHEDHLLAQDTVFKSLGESKDFYDQLIKNLEDPILESFDQVFDRSAVDSTQKLFMDSVSKTTSKQPLDEKSLYPIHPLPPMPQKSSLKEWDKISPLNRHKFFPFSVIKWDFAFSIGLYFLTLVAVGVVFSTPALPSVFFLTFLFGIFHQVYTALFRSLMGCTLGEERYNISWNIRSPALFCLRGLLVALTGFIFIPICSALFKRDLLEDCTGIRPQYNI